MPLSVSDLSSEVIASAFNLCEGGLASKHGIIEEFLDLLYESSEGNDYIHYYPRTLILQLTSGCNLRCKHCFFCDKPQKYEQADNLSESQIFEQIRYFVEEVNILRCIITGGEIFTSPFLLKVLEYLKEHSVSVKLITNGTLISAENIERLGKLLNPKYDLIQISLDGATQSTNDEIRGKGVYQKVINSVTGLAKSGCNVEIGFTVNSQNVRELADMYLFCQKSGVKSLNIGRFTKIYDNQDYLVPSLADIFINVAKLAGIYQNDIRINVAALRTPDFLQHSEGKRLLDAKLEKVGKVDVTNLHCKPHHEQVALFANGDVSLCYDCTIKDVIIGNIKNNSFAEIWNNRFEYSIFQNRPLENHTCNKCEYVVFCKAGCPYSAIVNSGSTLRSGFACQHLELLKEQENNV